MGESEQLGSWRASDYVAEWVGDDALADMLVLPQQISAALVADAGAAPQTIIDLGSGPGGYLDVMLRAFPNARGVWVDSSEPMLEVGRARLESFGERVDFVIGDAEWLETLGLPGAEVIVTSRAVHHFAPESVKALYRVCRELLADGGFFFNLDHYGAPPEWESRYRNIRRQFTGPRKGQPPHRHDVPFSPLPDHLSWLEEAGFESPDVPWRTFFTSLVAARTPE